MKILFNILLLFISALSFGQSLIVKVTSQGGVAIQGASVSFLNTNYGGVTDNSGVFKLDKIRAGNYVLKLSAIGYATQNKLVSIQKNEKIAVALHESSIKLDELVVSAEKQEELAQKLPMAVSVISNKQIEDYRLWDVKDVAAIVPNLNVVNPGDGKNNMSLRGIASASYDQPIATYVDGVNQMRLDAYIPQLLDVERIEILRGPQGTLYGRNAMGGVINIITKQPNNETKGFAELTFGDYGQQRYSLGFRTPIIRDKLFFGVSAMYSKQDGFYTNVFDNTKFDKAHNILGNYYLKYKASPHLMLTLNVKHYNRQSNGSFPLVNSAEQAFMMPFQVNYNAVATDHDNTLNASFTANYFGEKVDFTSITAYQSNARYYSAPIDADVQMPFSLSGMDINAVEIKNDKGQNTVKFWTQEFRLNSSLKNNPRFRWNLGSFLFTQNSPAVQALWVGKDAGLIGLDGGPYKIETNAQQNNYGIAIYGQTSYKLADRLDITAGLRYDYENQKLIVGSTLINGNFSMPLMADSMARTKFSALTPKLALSYNLSSKINQNDFSTGSLLYASYSRGFRTGGISQLSYDPSDAPLVKYNPEYSDNFELGIKTSSFENRLRTNLALFVTQVTNAQIPTLLPELGFTTAIKNAGNMKASGLELEIATTPVKNLQIEYTFGYTDAKYSTLKLPEYVDGNENKVEKDFSGNSQILTPNFTSMLAMQYSFSLTKNMKFLAHGDWKYIGSQYFNLENTIKQESYGLLNLRAGFSTKCVDIMFWGRNLSDARYIAYGYSFGAVTLGNPKTMGVTLTARF